jgi:tRNA(His) guanylyltransferase
MLSIIICRFTKLHEFDKPNDLKALELMNQAAIRVMENVDDLTLAYGQSDEYSFLFKNSTDFYSRRAGYAEMLYTW